MTQRHPSNPQGNPSTTQADTETTTIARELSAELTTEEGVDTVVTYAKTITWQNALTAEAATSDDCTTLDNALATTTWQYDEQSKAATIPITRKQLVTRVCFKNAPDNKSLGHLARTINLIASSAERLFEAHHDKVTGLLNKSGLAMALASWKPSLSASPQNRTSKPAKKYSQSMSMQVMVVDIDHFKQVNDSYGHLYGDSVLKCVGLRLRESVEHEASTVQASIRSVLVSRDGGEEFLIVVMGAADRSWAESFADRIRETIEYLELPSEHELRTDPSARTVSAGASPSASSRRVTVSIGLSGKFFDTWPQANDLNNEFTNLKERADMALYRAKSAGRNHVCVFANIAKEYGRVLEHHPDTDLVAIDLGKRDHVYVGQEFNVYHPDFTGKKEFATFDGRTKKTKGTYPKYPCGRLVIFAVQEEMSFCHVAESRKVSRFPPGCTLEAVPIGSIAHLLPDSTTAPATGAQLATLDSITSSVTRLANTNRQFAVVVVLIDSFYAVGQKYGNAAANRMLAQIYDTIRSVFGPKPLVAQIRPSEFAVLVEEDQLGPPEHDQFISHEQPDSLDPKTDEALKELEKYVPKPGEVFMGVAYGRHPEYKPEHVFELARYAASPSIHERTKIVSFNTKSAERLLKGLWERGDTQKAVNDYQRLRGLGVESADLDNIASLCAITNMDPDVDLALEASRRATEKDPNDPVLRLNRAVTEYVCGNKLAAYESFIAAQSMDDGKVDEIYLAPYAMSLLAKHESEPSAVPKEAVLEALVRAIDSPPPEVPWYHWENVKAELERLRSAPVATASESPT